MAEKKSKFLSRRFISALWAMVMISVIVFKDMEAFLSLTVILAGIIGVWIGAETVSKKNYNAKGGENEDL